MTAVLRGERLSWQPPGRDPVLRDVAIAVEAGELVALEGASGVGKTVLGTLLLRLRAAPGAVIHWSGRDVSTLGASALRPLRARHQALLQHTGASLPPHQSLGGALLESARHVARAEDPERAVARVAESLGLGSLLDRAPRFLSGGEQRRGGLARLLLTDPVAAWVDEPDAGLDPVSRLAALCLLRARCDAGMGCLVVTHNRDLARRFADRRLGLEGGRLRAL